MALNVNLIAKKLEELNNQFERNDGETSIFWKPIDKHEIRILPYLHDMENPFREIYYYYEFQGRPMVSPASYGEEDPVLEWAKYLQNTGNTEQWKQGKKLEPKRRTHVAILVRGKESEGVKFWGFSDTVYQQLTSIILNPEYGDITDLKTGVDLMVTMTPGTKDSYAKTSIMPKRSSTPATTDRAIAELIKSMPKIETVAKAASVEDLKKAMDNFFDPKLAESANPGTATANGTTPPAATAAPQLSDPASVNKALEDFGKLFTS